MTASDQPGSEPARATPKAMTQPRAWPVRTGIVGYLQPYMSDPGVVSTWPVSSHVLRPERIIGQPP